MTYLIDGLNFLFLRILFPTIMDKAILNHLTVMGILLIAVSILSIFERRPQLTGTLYSFVVGIIHWIFSIAFSLLSTWLWFPVFFIEEVLLCFTIALSVYMKTK